MIVQISIKETWLIATLIYLLYQLVPKAEVNDCQPEELNDEIMENNRSFVGQYTRILINNSVRLT